MAHPKIFYLGCILLLLALVEATPPGIANHPSKASCKIKKYKMCYNLEHVCPKFCPDSCTVECASCKPICGGSGSPPPEEEYSPPPSDDGGKGGNGGKGDGDDDKEGKGKGDDDNGGKDKGDDGKDKGGKDDEGKGKGGDDKGGKDDEGKGKGGDDKGSDEGKGKGGDDKGGKDDEGKGKGGDDKGGKDDEGKGKGDDGKGGDDKGEDDEGKGKGDDDKGGKDGEGKGKGDDDKGGKDDEGKGKGGEGSGDKGPPSSPSPSTPSTPPSSPYPTPPTPSTPSPSTPSTPPSSPSPTPSTPSPSTPSSPQSPPSSGVSPQKRVRCKNKNYGQCYGQEHVCPANCPTSCEVDCVTCKPVCSCDYPGAVCQDPRFIGADGITFYFHGKKDKDFCLVTDPNLHINAHFIGKRNKNMGRDFTWVQSIGILFDNHKLFVGAQKTSTWDDAKDRLALAFDGEPIFLQETEGSEWRSTTSPLVTIRRTSDANNVVVEVEEKLKITTKVVPITEEDSRVHNYGITKDDCFAHLDLGFKFYSLSHGVDGVLGKTYRDDYVSNVKVGVAMPVVGGEREYATSSLFATDCLASKFHQGQDGNILKALDLASLNCGSGMNGAGVVCKR